MSLCRRGNVHHCPDANSCLPSTCAEETRDYSRSCPSGYEEDSSAEYKHDFNRKSCGVPVVIDNADHASSGVIKFEEGVLCECHFGHSLDGTP